MCWSEVQNNNYKSFIVKPQKYRATDYQIEGDASAASYWTAIAFLHKGKVKFENLIAESAIGESRLKLHGYPKTHKSIQGDAKFSSVLPKLGKRTIDMSDIPDSAMTLVVMSPFVKGQTKITGLSTLRIKESDRIAALEKELRKIGVKVSTTKDSITIGGTMGGTIGGTIGTPIVPPIVTYNDHRMAMCFAVVGTKIPGIVIENPDCVDKTYPEFWNDLERMYLSQKIKLGNKNLVLTGMRCSGKNYLGKRIAKLLGRKFIDLDEEIEKSEKMTISDIVKKHGWPYFRKIEQKICSFFANAQNDKFYKPLVISTGGGVVLNPGNMKALKKNGVNVFIFADPQVLKERLRKSGNRPALKTDNPISELQTIWNERRGLYLKYADFVWDNTGGRIIRENLDRVFD